LRRALPVLREGSFESQPLDEPLLGWTRALDGTKLLCLFNVGAAPLTDRLSVDGPLQMVHATSDARLEGHTLHLPPFAAVVLRQQG
jgi:alpha-glucosidase